MRVCMYVYIYVYIYIYIYIYIRVCACAYACGQRQQRQQQHNKTSMRIDAPPSAERSRMTSVKQAQNNTLRRSTETILHHLRRTPPTHDSNTHATYNTTPSLALPPCNVDVWRGGAELFRSSKFIWAPYLPILQWGCARGTAANNHAYHNS